MTLYSVDLHDCTISCTVAADVLSTAHCCSLVGRRSDQADAATVLHYTLDACMLHDCKRARPRAGISGYMIVYMIVQVESAAHVHVHVHHTA